MEEEIKNLASKGLGEVKSLTDRGFNEGKKIEKELVKNIVGYLTAAFGLVVGLAWNDAVLAALTYYFPFDKNSVAAHMIYALVLTVVFVIVTVYVFRWISKTNGNDKE